jgi:hypothetical protein
VARAKVKATAINLIILSSLMDVSRRDFLEASIKLSNP